MPMKFCTSCSARHSDESNYCGHCAAALPEQPNENEYLESVYNYEPLIRTIRLRHWFLWPACFIVNFNLILAKLKVAYYLPWPLVIALVFGAFVCGWFEWQAVRANHDMFAHVRPEAARNLKRHFWLSQIPGTLLYLVAFGARVPWVLCVLPAGFIWWLWCRDLAVANRWPSRISVQVMAGFAVLVATYITILVVLG